LRGLQAARAQELKFIPTPIFDVIVVGLGAMGSAALWQLARRGVRTLGIDRFVPPHHLGSSHGRTRIIREAYYEHPLYVPLVRRARTLWHELEAATGEPLLQRTGAVMVGPATGALVPGALESAITHALQHECWTASDLLERYPAFDVPPTFTAVWEPGAGVLRPERCIALMLVEARRAGAQVLVDTPVTGWTPSGSHVVAATPSGDYAASRIVLTAGPWLGQLLLDTMALPLTLERAVQFWFAPSQARSLDPSRVPVFLIEDEPGLLFYGIPDIGHGLKVAVHHQGENFSLEAPRRSVSEEEIVRARSMVNRWLPSAAGPLLDATTCIYTNTPDGHFLIDRHRDTPDVLVASCCSGHGFKFAPAIGELLADLAAGLAPRFDLTPFRAGRFGEPTPTHG
jgi:sarcosine oxidase